MGGRGVISRLIFSTFRGGGVESDAVSHLPLSWGARVGSKKEEYKSTYRTYKCTNVRNKQKITVIKMKANSCKKEINK